MGRGVSRRLVLRVAGAVLPVAGVAACRSEPPSVGPPSVGPTTPVPAPLTGLPERSFVVRGVRIFDGERVAEADSVLVDLGVITAVGGDVAGPGGWPVLDGGARMLLPGLIDAHTHTASGLHPAGAALRFGVTTMIDMFTEVRLLARFQQQRAANERVTDADVWSAGTLVTAPGGHGTQYGLNIPTLAPGADAAAFVQARLDEGSAFIKIVIDDLEVFGQSIPTLTADQVAAVVTAAHERGARTAAHVSSAHDTAIAVAAGADLLAHAPIERLDEPLVASMREQGMAVVATLSVIAGLGCTDDATDLADDPRISRYLELGQGAGLTRRSPGCNLPIFEAAMANVGDLHRAGVQVLAGTDAPNPGTTHGASLHGELDLLVRAGLGPAEALVAATSAPADRFGITDRGRIAPGYRADLVLVEGDPTTTVTDTRNIVAIWKNGYPVTR